MQGFRRAALAGVALSMLWSNVARAQEPAPADEEDDRIIVTGLVTQSYAGTKTDTPLIETPQPITVVTEEMFTAQGAVSVSDTLNYVAGVTANTYGPDSRVDGATVRGVDPLQFRDGMRDIFSYYASIRSDPFNFSRIELVRGPASVLFGQGSIGGIFNMVSKTPEFETRGSIDLVYGSFDRKEALVDVTGPLVDGLAGRIVARVRDSGTQVDHVPGDRVMIAPSLTWRASDTTEITLIGLYQEDDGGSTSQFLPIVGTLYPNGTNPRLPNNSFIGKPGWDRYDGRLLQGTGIVRQQLAADVTLNLKARYIDSDLTYFTHYPDSYSNPANPYVEGTGGRVIGLYSDGSIARMNVFSTDNNVQARFNTGAAIEHTLLAGIDYSWNEVTKRGGFGYEFIDIYDIDYDALTIPTLDQYATRETQKQLGAYVQDQLRFWDRVSVVLGARRDWVRTGSDSSDTRKDHATTFRAGVIGEIGAGFSPFFSYTESFFPIAGVNSSGNAFVPQRGTQYEAGMKWQPDAWTLVTVTGFHIKESNRPIDDPSTPSPTDQTQSGELTTRGFEIEASRNLPGNFDILLNYGYNKLKANDNASAFSYLPRNTASAWGTKTFKVDDGLSLRLGAGVRHNSSSTSVGSWTIRTPAYTLVDAVASIEYGDWHFALNANNLLGEKFYASCLARGDCFIGADRNIRATVGVRF
ncbi:iron complex outermembrane receptor protein [Sphingomonas zeicaulis]|uniref:TonB-dependent siderophore receptor n=1 Tax=Sphingomonas zeicaulis TaxID=1632740 RepID=UPI003D23E73B